MTSPDGFCPGGSVELQDSPDGLRPRVILGVDSLGKARLARGSGASPGTICLTGRGDALLKSEEVQAAYLGGRA